MIQIEKLTKAFTQDGKHVVALDGIGLEIPHGEICVLLGPSGCGKTTTLKIINRLVTPSGGRVLVDGQDTGRFDVIELRRKIGYVIQQVGLFPHMTVEENIGVVPRLLGWPAEKRGQRALDLLRWSASIPVRTQAATPESCRAARHSGLASRGRSPPTRRSC